MAGFNPTLLLHPFQHPLRVILNCTLVILSVSEESHALGTEILR
jgi:hypothetical protein